MKYISQILMLAVMADIVILLWTMLAISSGQPVYHVPFFDYQIKLITSL